MRIYILLIVWLLFFPASISAEIIIIVNESLPVSEISQEDIAKIFLGKKTTWENGYKINVVILEDGLAHRSFLKEIVKKNSAQFDTYWKRMVFTGHGQALKTFNTETHLVEYIAGTSHSIGYIDSSTPHSNVKTIVIK